MNAEQPTREMLRALLGDVPLTRGAAAGKGASQEAYLSALTRAALFYPVFQGWPSPVPAWLDELEGLAEREGRTDLVHIARVRAAVVRMRFSDYTGASELLTKVAAETPVDRVRHWMTVTQARVSVRVGQLEEAADLIEEARGIPVNDDDWIATLADLAHAELLLESNDDEEAEEAFLRALTHLPRELLEERVQALQSLGFIYITQADAVNAVKYLGDARELLRGAGIWSEVIQMNLVIGSLSIPLGNTAAAAALFEEALELCREHDAPQYEGILKVMVARARAAAGDSLSAIAATLDAAGVFAEHGQAVSYMGMITFLSELYLKHDDPEQAYETLLTGVSIAKRLRLPRAERALRSRIERLRQIVLGPRKFEAMVERILLRKKQAMERPPNESQT
jgi:tetratricopeptide (TPR) repeat protein